MKPVSRGGIQPPQIPAGLDPLELAILRDGDEFSRAALSGDCTGQAAGRLLLEQCVLRRVTLLNTRLRVLRGADCRLERCDLSGAQWEGARLRRVELRDCRLRGANFSDARIEEAVFTGCSADEAYFAGAVFQPARFVKCSLRAVSFEGADLGGVTFNGCDLSGANLTGAKLTGADFRSATIDGLVVGIADLRGARVTPAQALQVAALLGIEISELDDESSTSI